MVQCVRSLDLANHTSLSPIRRGFAPSFVSYKNGALDSQPQVIKFKPVACPRSMVLSGYSAFIHHDIAEILLKMALKLNLSINQSLTLLYLIPQEQ